jgi:HD-GYP domain-containing protein (c-di-GMP phosphodiesterase class II)
MFDILKSRGEDNNIDGSKEKDPFTVSLNNKKKEKKPQSPPISFPKEIRKINISASGGKQEKRLEDHSLVSQKLISAVKKHGVDDQEKAKEIYKDAAETVKNLLTKIRVKEDLVLYMDKLYGLLDNIFNQLVLGDSILDNIYESGKDEYYLPYHIVNVLVLSTVLGMNMGFNKSRLSHLGLASIFYDVGMDTLQEIASQSRELSKEEYNIIKTHISKSLEVVEKISTINEVVKETIGMHHERMNRNGYPRGIKSDKINSYAKILGLVDTYEALTHDRPHREGINTHKAVKFLVGSLKDDFDTEVMKVFINKMSVYPIGSIVRLDTGEVARVIGTQPGSPLKPVVILLRDVRGEPVKERTIIDLSKQSFPSIKDSV